MRILGWMGVVLTFCLLSEAFGNPPGSNKTPVSGTLPRISAEGYRKIQENLGVLDINIKDVERNILASTKNIKVISDELKELNQLEIEHVELRKRFLEYLQIADKEIIKNQKSIERLEKLEKELFRLRSKGEGDALELDFVSRERTDRNVWKDDASIKVNKAKNRCAEIEKNMKEIEQRRSSLKSEHKSWTERVEEYQKLRKDLTDRKEEYERMAKGK